MNSSGAIVDLPRSGATYLQMFDRLAKVATARIDLRKEDRPRPCLMFTCKRRHTSPVTIWKVCTLGRNIGAVLFNNGRRVRNSPLNELYTSRLGSSQQQF